MQSYTATMRAVRYHGPGEQFHRDDVAIPVPRPGQALVRVGAAGICHTDLHMQHGILNMGVAPLVPGHEIAGEVVSLGDGTDAFKPGDRVAVSYYVGCGRCGWCRQGMENLCLDLVARQAHDLD